MPKDWTAGPWRMLLYGSTDDANVATRIDVTDSSRVEQPHFCVPIAVCRRVAAEGHFNFNPPNAEANGRLIAASPELFEALATLVRLNDNPDARSLTWLDAWNRAEEVLAKAKGEEL